MIKNVNKPIKELVATCGAKNKIGNYNIISYIRTKRPG